MSRRIALRIGGILLTALLVAGVVRVTVVLHSHSVVELKDQRISRWATRQGFVEKEVRGEDYRVRYWVGGQGEPVLLVHGFASYGIWNWSSQMRALDDEYRLIVPDLPGFGESYIHDGAMPDLELEAAALRSVLDAEGVERAHVVASSYGGFVALTLATESPERVGRLALIDSPGHTYTHDDHLAMLQRLDVPATEELFLPADSADLRALLGAASRIPTRLIPEFMVVDLYQDLIMPQEATKAALVADLERREDMPPPPVRGEDILVIWGTRDGLFPVEVGERLAGDLGARFVEVRRTAHRPHAERAPKVNRELRRFLSGGEALARR